MLIAGEPCLVEVCAAAEADAIAAAAGAHGAPPELFSPAEMRFFAGLKTAKKRRDWLAGRVAAKRALARFLRERGQNVACPAIELSNDATGRPLVRILDAAPPAQPVGFSISHCAEGGACAVAPGPVGLDWETIAARQESLMDMILHPSESRPLTAFEQTRLWTLKEAILKLLGLGFSCNPADIRVDADGGCELYGTAWTRWREMGAPRLRLETRRAGAGVIALAYC